MSAETIYQSIYVQSRGALRLSWRCPAHRAGAAASEPQGRAAQKLIPNMIHIAERPAESRTGRCQETGGGTRSSASRTRPRSAPWSNVKPETRCCCTCRWLQARAGPRRMAAKIQTLPESLRLSLNWTRAGRCDWKHVAVDADIDIYFCDPHSPWQRGTNENTNGLLRQASQGHSPFDPQRLRSRLGRPRTQRPTPQTTSVQEADRTHRRPTVAMTARIRRALTGHRQNRPGNAENAQT